TLNWTGDPGFTFDGVEPDSANSGAVFGFRVEFTDLDNLAPATKEVWIDLDDSSSYEPGEKFDMIEFDPGDTNYQDGKDYFFARAITRTGDGTLDYQFYFRDSEADATGDPASAHSLVVNALSGEVLEAKTFGGTSSDSPQTVQQTSDGGYAVVANTGSFGTGSNDIWMLKLNTDFSVAWEKTYGGTGNENVAAMQQTQDGGYIVVGKSASWSTNTFWILKLASNGTLSWQRRYTRNEQNQASSVRETPDGGYIVAGYTSSYTNPGSIVIWVMKLNSIGTVVWEYTYDGGDDDRAYSVQCTADGGYVLAGTTESSGAGSTDIWVLKLNSNGTVAWQKTYGGTGYEEARSIQQTTDGGYIVGGRSNSFVPGVTKMWVLKLDATGNVDWQKTYSGMYGDTCNSIQQTADGGYIVAGDTLMGSEMESPVLIWLIKLQPNGDYMWAKTYGSTMEWAPSIQQTSDGGYIAAGSTYSYGAGSTDVWMLRVDANGEIPGCSEMGSKTPLVADTSVVGQNTNVTPFGVTELIYVTTGTTLDSSATTSVQCTFTPLLNYPPVAVAGDDYSVAVNDLVSLDGSESYDPDGHDPITYLWTIISKPVGSTAVLSDPIAVDPTFTADVVGYYTIELVVTDNLGESSSPDQIIIGAPDQLPISRTYGGTSSDYPASIQQTTDGGYIVAGKTQSFGSGNTDAWILKLNTDLTVAWEKTFGGTGGDYAFTMQQTTDDGYVFAGNSWSFGEDGFWVVKLDSAGTIDWEKKYSRGNMVEAYSIQQTADGGYIVAGGTRSYGTPGSLVAWVLKLDANGDVVWENTYDGPGNDAARSVQETADGGYIVAGNYGYDFWVLKLASGGTIEWQKTYGGNDNEYAYAVQQTADGGYIVGGESWDFFDSDIWVLKLDSVGNITWKNKYSWSDPTSIDDEFGSIQQTADGGYIIGGHTYLSWDGEEGPDLWIIKIDSSGQVTWDKTYGGYTSDWGAFARQTADGGYVLTGMTSSYGAGYNDIWVLKLDPNGELPSCSAMGTKGALANSISVTVLDTTEVPQATTYSVSDTTATVIDTSADISLVCMYSPPWNELPVADAGDTQAVFTNTLVTLDGSGSYDMDGDYPLTYDWTMISKPVSSTAVLSDPTLVNPTFTADLVGDYTIRLVVIDTLDGMSELSQVVVKAVVPAANPPTLAWTGDPGYESDGVDPDVGDSGSYFNFRVEYTHPDNYPPTINEVWIDLNDNGTFESFEKLDMGEVDSGDTNYQDGKDYVYSRSIDYAGDGVRKYKFDFHYGGDAASGPPALDDTWYFTVNVPTGSSYYVDGDNGSPQPPYDETSNAATSIQEAINYCKQYGDGTGTFYVKQAAIPYNQTSTIMMETNISLKGRDENWNQPTASDYSDCPAIHGDSVEAVRFEGVSNVTLDGFVLTGGPGIGGIVALDGTVTEVANVTIRNCQVGAKGTTWWNCISLYGAVGATIEGCDLGYGRVGIGGALMNQITPASSPLVIRRNMIHDCDAGMRLYGGSVGGHDITIGGDSLDGNQVFSNNNVGIYLQELGTVQCDP
ncbi:MAG: hypothetical protein JRF69_07140, partial [Deltaproteobacteria bacterium]|nr:hypothetical protein [Deltaproteobacteria bacterium]